MPKEPFDLQAYRGARLEAIYPAADATLGEALQDDELSACADLIASLAGKVRRDYAAGLACRDAHPKAHGCVTARLDIEADLSPDLTGGVFQPGASHEAVVRFSNGSPDPGSSDAKGDTRGMAIKLFGVTGKKLFPDPGNPDAQDFIMISSPNFFINSARNYSRFFDAVNSGALLKLAGIPFYLGVRGSLQAVRMLRQTIANPLETRYWSVVPAQLGEGAARQAVKLSVRPLGTATSTIPANPARDFLRAAMARTLRQGPWQMEFLVQRCGDSGLRVEDSVTEWPEARAPFRRVGTLTIHAQEFDTVPRNTYCENLSFNPWHSLAAHRPLGMISRTRRAVYQAIAELRHEMNDATYSSGLPDSGVLQ